MTAVREGALGVWDRIVGPGMTPAENTLVISSGILASLLAAYRLAATDAAWWLVLLGAAIAFDVVGGAVCNATETTKNWYSRPGQGLFQRASFVAPHIAYVAVVAWLWRDKTFDLTYFEWAAGALVVSTAIVLAMPPYLKRPMAFALYLGSLFTVAAVTGLTYGLEWFLPALLLKLLVGYLVPERPHRA